MVEIVLNQKMRSQKMKNQRIVGSQMMIMIRTNVNVKERLNKEHLRK